MNIVIAKLSRKLMNGCDHVLSQIHIEGRPDNPILRDNGGDQPVRGHIKSGIACPGILGNRR